MEDVSVLRHAKTIRLKVVLSTHGQLPVRVLECVPFIDWLAIPVDAITPLMLAQMRGRQWGIDEASSIIQAARSRINVSTPIVSYLSDAPTSP